jgi:hypothetical protein
MINFGRDFDQDPNLPWAAEILKKPRNPEGKMHLLFRMAFYPGYCLHGVYSASNGSNAWTPAEGERIRAGLNRRLGEELVQCGPFDLWARRHQSQPRFPILLFDAEGQGHVVRTPGDLRAVYHFRKINPEFQLAGGGTQSSQGDK